MVLKVCIDSSGLVCLDIKLLFNIEAILHLKRYVLKEKQWNIQALLVPIEEH